MSQKYVSSQRYDKSLRRTKIYGLCPKCGVYGFAVTCRIRSKNRISQDIPLPMKYCLTCKCITLLDSNLKILDKDGEEI